MNMHWNPKPKSLEELEMERGYFKAPESQARVEKCNPLLDEFLRYQQVAHVSKETTEQKIARLEKRLDELEAEMKEKTGWRLQIAKDEFVALYRELRDAKGIPIDGIRFNEVLK